MSINYVEMVVAVQLYVTVGELKKHIKTAS